MPLPEPSGGQTEQEWMAECMADDGMLSEFPEEEQRAAVCHRQFESKNATMTTKHQELVAAIRARKGAPSRFGYGIATADGIVAKALDEIGDGFCKRIGGAAGSFDKEVAVKEAAGRLVCCTPDAKVEQTATCASFKSLLPDGIEAPPHTLMVLRYTLTTARKDRDGDILHPEGGDIDPAGPMLWQHLFNLPIGKMLSVVEKSAKRIREIGCLLDLNELTEDCAKLFEAGALRFSHGFQALDWRELKAEPDRYGKGRSPGKIGFEVIRYEILERSAVSVPSNPDAIPDLVSRGKLKSDLFKKQAEVAMRNRKTAVPGVTLPAEPAAPSETKAEEAPAEEKARMIECPECGGPAVQIGPGKAKCKDCGEVDLPEEKAAAPAEETEESETIECPECGAAVPEDATECPECGAKVGGEEEAEEEKATEPDDTKASKWPDPETVMVCAKCGYRAPKRFWTPEKVAANNDVFTCPKCKAAMEPEGEAAATEEEPVEKQITSPDEPVVETPKAGIWVTVEQMEKVCPNCAKTMRDKNLSSVNVEALEPDVLRKFLAAKAGRVLSAANVQKLQDCLDDLEELAGMDLPRAAGALAGRIVQTLGALVDAATPPSDEPPTEKQINPLASWLAKADAAELKRVRDIVQAMLDVQAIDAAGAEYRKLVSC